MRNENTKPAQILISRWSKRSKSTEPKQPLSICDEIKKRLFVTAQSQDGMQKIYTLKFLLALYSSDIQEDEDHFLSGWGYNVKM